jgi:hypothetical protein
MISEWIATNDNEEKRPHIILASKYHNQRSLESQNDGRKKESSLSIRHDISCKWRTLLGLESYWEQASL